MVSNCDTGSLHRYDLERRSSHCVLECLEDAGAVCVGLADDGDTTPTHTQHKVSNGYCLKVVAGDCAEEERVCGVVGQVWVGRGTIALGHALCFGQQGGQLCRTAKTRADNANGTSVQQLQRRDDGVCNSIFVWIGDKLDGRARQQVGCVGEILEPYLHAV
ncbi:hypothetical protein BC831DRAFT_448228, partial [Entophlyctis helioformis]